MDFKGKVAIVSGGAQGIGKAMSMALLELGMKVLICDLNESSAKAFLNEVSDNLKPNIIYQKCDVTSFDDYKAAFVKTKLTFGRIDVLMNNAGMLSETQWKRMIEVNFIGVVHGLQLAFQFMGKNNGGSGGIVINTASRTGLTGVELVPVYSATKHAVVGLTRSFGTQYHFEKTGVQVKALCPGPIDTPLFQAFPRLSLNEERGAEYATKFSSKVFSPQEIAKDAIQLLQDGKNGALLRIEWGVGRRYEE